MSEPLPTRRTAPKSYVAITPADATLLQGFQRLRVGVAGNLVLKGTEPGATPVTLAVAALEYVPFGAGYVMAATSATGIVGFA